MAVVIGGVVSPRFPTPVHRVTEIRINILQVVVQVRIFSSIVVLGWHMHIHPRVVVDSLKIECCAVPNFGAEVEIGT